MPRSTRGELAEDHRAVPHGLGPSGRVWLGSFGWLVLGWSPQNGRVSFGFKFQANATRGGLNNTHPFAISEISLN